MAASPAAARLGQQGALSVLGEAHDAIDRRSFMRLAVSAGVSLALADSIAGRVLAAQTNQAERAADLQKQYDYIVVDLPEVLKPTSTFAFSSAVPYSLAALPSSPTVSQLNAGISPTMPNGVVSLFTDPSQTTVIQARLDRIAIIHPERNDMTMVGFRLTFIDSNGVDNRYRGRYIEPVYAYTIVARLD